MTAAALQEAGRTHRSKWSDGVRRNEKATSLRPH
jgi:hypothetical protein